MKKSNFINFTSLEISSQNNSSKFNAFDCIDNFIYTTKNKHEIMGKYFCAFNEIITLHFIYKYDISDINRLFSFLKEYHYYIDSCLFEGTPDDLQFIISPYLETDLDHKYRYKEENLQGRMAASEIKYSRKVKKYLNLHKIPYHKDK